MTRKIFCTPFFQACWQSLGLSKTDLKEFKEELAEDPESGESIPDCDEAKIYTSSFNNENDDSISIDVVYISFSQSKCICILFAYDTMKQLNLTEQQKRIIVGSINNLKGMM